MKSFDRSLIPIGWREWVAIPDLGIEQIKAKVDTGARTTALHASEIEIYQDPNGVERVKFKAHPRHRDPAYFVACDSPLSDCRSVRNSGGREELRPFITIPIKVGNQIWTSEISLTNRSNMKFRMLLGRTALKGRFAVDSGSSYLIGTKSEAN